MTSSQPDTPSPQPLSRKQETGSSTRERGSGPAGFMLEANGDAPANVHAFTTLRCGAGSSQAPFDELHRGHARAAASDECRGGTECVRSCSTRGKAFDKNKKE